MRADLQESLSPFTAVDPQSFSDAKVKADEKALDSTQPNKASFKDVLTDSMAEVKKEREAKKNNDLSSAKTDKEFLDKLQEMSKPKTEIKNTLDKDDFLKLFVAQLQNQDPLNPDDGAEMAAKLAQFNSLEQMMNVNKNLEKMSDQQKSDHTTQLVNYINKEVTTSGGKLTVSGNRVLNSSTLDLPVEAATVNLEVRDSAGTVIAERAVGALPAGNHTLNWDGKNAKGEPVPDGNYTFTVTAKNADGGDVPANITSKTVITGVDFQDKDGGFFTTSGRVKNSEISSIGNQGFRNTGMPSPAMRTAPQSAPAQQGEGQPQPAEANTAPIPASAENAPVAPAPRSGAATATTEEDIARLNLEKAFRAQQGATSQESRMKAPATTPVADASSPNAESAHTGPVNPGTAESPHSTTN